MDPKTGANEQSAENNDATQAAEAAEAQAGFEAGFARVAKTDDDATLANDDTTNSTTNANATPDTGAAKAGQNDDAAAAAAAAAATPNEWEGVPAVIRKKFEALDALTGRMRNIEGHIGGLNNGVKELKAALDTAQAASTSGKGAPSQDAIVNAAGSTEKWELLKAQWPEWAEGFEELVNTRSGGQAVDVEKLTKDVTGRTEAIVQSGLNEAEERALVRFHYPTWRADVKTPEFGAWLEKQPDDIKKLCDSTSADDTLKVLGAYKEHRESVKAAEATRLRNQRRVQGAITPLGTGAAPGSGAVDDNTAFVKGFKKVHQTPK